MHAEPSRISGIWTPAALWIFCIALIFVLPQSVDIKVCAAASVTLEWDRNPERDIAGYRLHHGQMSRSYTESIHVGNVIRFTLHDLSDNAGYYFAVTAFNWQGLESGYSNEVFCKTPYKAPIRTARNRRPRAKQLSFSTLKDMPYLGELSATDPEGDPIHFMIVRQGKKGFARLIDAERGYFLYIPLPGATGRDMFRFRADDGRSISNTSQVRVTIIAERPVSTRIDQTSTSSSLAFCGCMGFPCFEGDIPADMLSLPDPRKDTLQPGTISLDDLDEDVLKGVGDFEIDFIKGNGIESFTWQDLIDRQGFDFQVIGGINVLLPIEKQHWGFYSVVGCKLSQDYQSMTVLLQNRSGSIGDLNTGRMAICARYPGEDWYVGVFLRECVLSHETAS